MQTTIAAKSLFPLVTELPGYFQEIFPIEQKEYLEGGKLKQWSKGQQEVYSPIITRKEGKRKRVSLGHYPLMDKNTALQVLDSAVESYDNGKGPWAIMPVIERVEYIENFKRRLRSRRDQIIKLLMWEIGKSYNDSADEFDRTIKNIDDTIEEIEQLHAISQNIYSAENLIVKNSCNPLGVVLCMGPFNFPLNETFATLMPALAMGNSVIFKPPKHGVLLHYPILEIFKECFPAGVINTVYGAGEEVIAPVLQTGKVDVLAFIGTSRVANILKTYHPKPNRLREILGLEAKNPAIVLQDADLDLAVKECLAGALKFNGQRCTALKMLYVHESVIEEFLDKFAQLTDRLKVGMPWEEGVDITPLPEENKTTYLRELVYDARRKGARVINVNGGKYEGTVFFPTILYPVKNDMRIYHEEQFGPVVPITTFRDIHEPLDYVENSAYGQQVSIFGRDTEAINKLTIKLLNQVARVNINNLCKRGPDFLPFTGRKDSAKGTLSNSDALKAFSLNTVITTTSEEENQQIINHI